MPTCLQCLPLELLLFSVSCFNETPRLRNALLCFHTLYFIQLGISTAANEMHLWHSLPSAGVSEHGKAQWSVNLRAGRQDCLLAKRSFEKETKGLENRECSVTGRYCVLPLIFAVSGCLQSAPDIGTGWLPSLEESFWPRRASSLRCDAGGWSWG